MPAVFRGRLARARSMAAINPDQGGILAWKLHLQFLPNMCRQGLCLI